MNVQEIMTTDVEVVPPTASVREAADKMRKLNVGSLPVCDGLRLVGMITDRDIAVRAVAEGGDPERKLVRDHMSPEIVYCFEQQQVKEAEHIMREKQIRRLPVLDRNKQLVGILALGDVATKSGNVQQVGQTIRDVSEPSTGGAG